MAETGELLRRARARIEQREREPYVVGEAARGPLMTGGWVGAMRMDMDTQCGRSR
jgi:hypothetical protein